MLTFRHYDKTHPSGQRVVPFHQLCLVNVDLSCGRHAKDVLRFGDIKRMYFFPHKYRCYDWTQCMWTCCIPESTGGQQQGQQKEEHESHSPKGKHLRPAPSPSCICNRTKLDYSNNLICASSPDLLRNPSFLRVDSVKRN